MTHNTAKKLFLIGAIFNWVIAVGLFLMPGQFLGLFQVTPLPEQSLWVQQFAGLVFIFGVGYYWVSQDFHNNQSIIRMAIPGKLGVTAIGLLNVITGDISWQFMIPASADTIFAILFLIALRSAPHWQPGTEV